MTAYSHNSYAAREKVPGRRTPRVTINHEHPLNNQHRAPYGSGAHAARALFVHAQRQLGGADTGAAFFNRLRQIYDNATVSGRDVQEQLERRRQRAATALQMGDVELSDAQIPISFEMAQIQAEIAGILLPEIQAAGRQTSEVIDDVDVVTRNAMRAAAVSRLGVDFDGADPATAPLRDPNAWQGALLNRLAAVPEHDSSNDADLVARFGRVVYQLEATLPLAVERDEPLWDIGDDFYDPSELAATRDSLSAAQGASFNPDDMAAVQELDETARRAVYESMSMDEREFAATHVALTPGQRIEAGMAIINSTPPIIELPEAKLAEGRYDIVMTSEEEAVVMDGLIRWAGETRSYPGPEAAIAQTEAMKSLPMPSGELGAATIALVVDGNPAAISHAQAMARALHGRQPDARLVVMGDADVVAQVMAARRESVEAAGGAHDLRDGSDATRAFGGWTLPGDADRALPNDRLSADQLVAAADDVIVYGSAVALETTTVGQSQQRLRDAQALVATTDRELSESLDEAASKGGQQLRAAVQRVVDGKGRHETLGEDLRGAGAKGAADLRLADEVVRRSVARSAAFKKVRQAETVVSRLQSQSKSNVFDRSTPAQIAQARVIDVASRQGKLRTVYHEAGEEARSAVQTKAGSLVEIRSATALRSAETLLDGESYRARDFRDALGSGIGSRYTGRASVVATFMVGSNVFDERLDMKTGQLRNGRDGKPAEPNAGIRAIAERMDLLPKNGVLVVEGNDKNPIVLQALAREKRVVHAVAWRVDHGAKTIIDGRERNMRDLRTELDLGTVGGRQRDGEKTSVRARGFSAQDLKDSILVVHGGGSMSRTTYDAVQQEAVRRGRVGHALDQNEVMGIHADLVARGMRLDAPQLASPKHARAITQETIVGVSDQGIVASEMRSDYNAANYMRLAIDSDKLIAAIDRDGRSVPIEEAREHASQYARSIADNTLNDLKDVLTLPAASPSAQLALAQHKGVSAERATEIGRSFGTLADVMAAAEAGEVSAALPRSLHHQLGLANAWKKAVVRADEIEERAVASGMSGIVPTDPAYPDQVKATGRTPILYAMKDVDLTQPTVALLAGGDRTNEADLTAARTMAATAAKEGYAVSMHLSGDASAKIAVALAGMPDEERPRLLLVGNGHPTVHTSPTQYEAIVAVLTADRGGYVTAVPPLPNADSDRDQLKEDTFAYLKDSSSAIALVANQATAAVLVRSTGDDQSLVALRDAIRQDKPIAVVGPVQSSDPQIADSRFRGADYSANRRLVEGGGSIKVMMDTRYMAFEPSFIPDMSGDMENRYVPFEGSTAGKQNLRDMNRDDEQDPNRGMSSGSAVHTTVDWSRPAVSVQDGRGFGDFIAAVEEGRVESIRATEADRIAESLRNDARFLDVASRDSIGAEVREVFSEIADRSAGDIAMDVQDQFLRQRAGAGR